MKILNLFLDYFLHPTRIKEEIRGEEKWYIAERRIYLFFWTKWFPSKIKGIKCGSFSSMCRDDIEIFNLRYGYDRI